MRFYSAIRTNTQTQKKVTITTLQNLYKNNEPITVLTAHDYPSGLFVEKTGLEICLVGDSLGMVALGRKSVNQTTIEEMLHHCRAVSRGAKTPFLVGDMPFGSYETSSKDALRNAIRYIKEGNMEAIKLEGGSEMARTIHQITSIGIPVLGHIGLTPQRQSSLGGFRVQGKTAKQAIKLLDDAKALQRSGCFAIVLEAIPGPVAAYITEQLQIPTIGIGAGSGTSGQVLVQQDMLGIYDKFVPKFCKQYAKLDQLIIKAIGAYRDEVKSRAFPAEEHSYAINDDELKTFLDTVKKEKE
ncbi:ketopantoate hydroxymethyltransferase [Gigaspora rosea]|uniref:3-methyl-2-oxobutanoate hydroxymethyltransferase n=1 Tax=Gigaspora rosea TaxID=44941 RepID=A0A397VGC8_9GLOM|nr:ketopantoate hydroxymethyltransferase [Gigaspora rosea]